MTKKVLLFIAILTIFSWPRFAMSQDVRDGIWISRAELRALPTPTDVSCDKACAAAWRYLVRQAAAPLDHVDLSDIRMYDASQCVANAYLFEATRKPGYRQRALHILSRSIGTEQGGVGFHRSKPRTLDLGHKLAGLVICAEVLRLPTTRVSFNDDKFVPWLVGLLSWKARDKRTLIECQEQRPNNWGTNCAASVLATSLYIMRYASEVDDRIAAKRVFRRSVRVFKGFLGDTESYNEFRYGSDQSWSCGSERKPINPKGCRKDGLNLDGVVPDDQRRCGSLQWPPCRTNYPYNALSGAFIAAEILKRQGISVYQIEHSALRRAVAWLNSNVDGKLRMDTCQSRPTTAVLELADFAYKTNFRRSMSCYSANDASWKRHAVTGVGWTHQSFRSSMSVPAQRYLATP